jgi:hypothetical protein
MLTLRIRSVMWFAAGLVIAIVLAWSFAAWRASAIGANESTFVPVTPVRILDTRDPTNVGLAGPFVSAVPQDLQVTGNVATTTGNQVVVPAGSTGVVLNVTAVSPTANGFISIRPADAPGLPTTSSLNFNTGDILPNAVSVSLPTVGADAGKIEITFDSYGTAGPTTDILIDVVGYNTHAGLQDLETRLATLEANTAVKTVLAYNGADTLATATGNFELIRTVGNFTKQRAGSTLRLDWSAHSTRAAGLFCHYQLRIDGRANDGDNAVNYQGDQEGNVVSYSLDESVATFAEFAAVPAGVHTVQIYLRSLGGSTCTLNFGNFNQQVVVEEYQAAATSAFSADTGSSDTGEAEGGQ